MAKTPSPCIDVCKFKRQGHCIGCSMTKAQKTLLKELKKNQSRDAFIEMLVQQQGRLGQYSHWAPEYLKKCKRKKVKAIKAVEDIA